MRPVFKDSIFTTTDIVFCDAPNLCRRNPDAEFYGLEVLTSCGTYDSILRGHIVFPEDHTVIPLRPGATIVFPAGTKRYFFIPVAADETRFLLRQFVHGGVMRWLVKDLRSDASFEDGGSAEELAAWYKTRAARGKNCAKLYSKLQDVYVF
ncbi:hypothetical protein C8R44DRAFT_645818 [Mycena epipterygia]|nr:hypothetical protein C8R44DRAFT_645818 [Mycena epipterygia]